MRHSLFALKHPLVIFVYFCAVIVLCMCTLNPVFVLLSFLAASALLIATSGVQKWARTLLIFAPALLIISGANFFFNRIGETILFSWGTWNFSLESLIYGVTSSFMLLAVIIWFMNYQEIMTNDKFLALFSRIAPTSSLVVSMIFRFIPQLSAQGRAITLAQKTLLGDAPDTKRGAVSYTARITSILMGWSMEQSIETADSMRARGYGAQRRTTFSSFRFTLGDGIALGVLCALLIASAGVLIANRNNAIFYPYFELTFPPLWQLIVYSALITFPFLIEARGRLS